MSNLKEEHRKKVSKKIDEAVGRPATTEKEERVRAATAAVLSGNSTFSEAQRLYAVKYNDIQKFLTATFQTEDDRYKFMEDCMLTNAMLATGVFQKKYGELSAIDAARAASIFADKAVTIKKAREAGFKEPPINIGVIVSLEKTLKALTPKIIDEIN